MLSPFVAKVLKKNEFTSRIFESIASFLVMKMSGIEWSEE
jgi:hypothetical protein